jgi:ParB family chromosome partitioning protein
MQASSPLGKGLSALLTSTDPQKTAVSQTGYLPEIPLSEIDKNPYQPRTNVSEGIDDLVNSIKSEGFFSPIIVTKQPNGRYMLVAGERRITAAKMAGLSSVPAIVREVAGEKLLELAIIENVQRKDLNPVEEANAFAYLQKEFGLSIRDTAKKIGIKEALVKTRLDLLELPDYVQQAVLDNTMHATTAQVLLMLKDHPELMQVAFKLCVKNQLNSLQLQNLVQKLASGVNAKRMNRVPLDTKSREMQGSISKLMGRKVLLTKSGKSGRITIPFDDDQELEDIYKRLSFIGYHI